MKRILKLAGLPVVIAAGLLLWLAPVAHTREEQVCSAVLIMAVGTLLVSLSPALRMDGPALPLARARRLDSNEYSLREVLEMALEPFKLEAARKGVQLVVGVPDSIPDRFRGTGAGLEKVIAKQISDIVRVAKSGHVVFEVSSEKQPDGRMKFRFRAGAMSSCSQPMADSDGALAPARQRQERRFSAAITSIHGMHPFRA